MPRAEAEPPAAALGVAFQLTNFLRDVGEDLDRGRVYLPADELAAFGVDRELLRLVPANRRVGSAGAPRAGPPRRPHPRRVPARRSRASRCWSRCRGPASAARSGSTEGILDEIEKADYDVLHRRVAVPNRRRAAVALPGLARALTARALTRN